MFEKILVALDSSPEAPAVFDFALSIAQPKISKILLLHFMDWQRPKVSPWAGIATLADLNLSRDRVQRNRQHWQTKIQQRKTWLQNYAQKAIALNIPCESRCQIGDCNLGISEHAQKWGADVIVVGRRNQTQIGELLSGSVSNYIIHHAPCSILVVQGVKERLRIGS